MTTFTHLQNYINYVHHCLKLHKNLSSTFQVIGNYLSRSKVKVKDHQDLTTST